MSFILLNYAIIVQSDQNENRLYDPQTHAEEAAIGESSAIVPQGETDVSVTPTEGGVDISLRVGEISNKEVIVKDSGGKVIATLHKGTLAAGSHSFHWDAGDKVATGNFKVEVSSGGAPTLDKEFSYTKPKLPSRKSIMPEVTFPSWNK